MWAPSTLSPSLKGFVPITKQAMFFPLFVTYILSPVLISLNESIDLKPLASANLKASFTQFLSVFPLFK